MLFQQYVESAQQFFDDLVDRASDDELFAGGYLRGHFDLAVGYAQVEGEDLVKAYRNGELTEDDKTHVVNIWEQVKALA